MMPIEKFWLSFERNNDIETINGLGFSELGMVVRWLSFDNWK
jgi:hypothetical protein